MMRIRIDGGAHDHRAAARDRVGIASAYGRDVADVTDRQNVQLHWIRIEDVPAIWERLEATGLTTAGGVRRHAARDPGLPAGRRRGRRGARRHAGHPRGRRALHRRPRVLEPAAQVQDLDQRLRRATARTTRSTTSRSSASIGPDGAPGYRPVGRRRPVHEPDVRAAARRVRASPTRVPEVWAGVTGLFREYGYRRSRNHARFKFLVKDWGAERVREVLETGVPGRAAARRARPARPRLSRARPRRRASRSATGASYVGFAPRAGRIAGHQLRLVADLADGVRQRQRARDGAAEARDRRRRARRARTNWSSELDDLDLPRPARRRSARA